MAEPNTPRKVDEAKVREEIQRAAYEERTNREKSGSGRVSQEGMERVWKDAMIRQEKRRERR
jgi:hypothetical protein